MPPATSIAISMSVTIIAVTFLYFHHAENIVNSIPFVIRDNNVYPSPPPSPKISPAKPTTAPVDTADNHLGPSPAKTPPPDATTYKKQRLRDINRHTSKGRGWNLGRVGLEGRGGSKDPSKTESVATATRLELSEYLIKSSMALAAIMVVTVVPIAMLQRKTRV
ncbi:hypothetical protein M426DRAFT_260180 [Hypoxylon sp. CI-4A]|nr:hypothetical protein M426DRAFT_260180 [Hypoxylon sp. CI-4A]